MPPLIDLTGQVFNEWTVLSRSTNEQGRDTRWLCRCSCGNEVPVTGNSLRHGTSKTCGHIKSKRVGHLGASFFCRMKAGARRRGLAVEVDLAYLSALLEGQSFTCALSGVSIWAAKTEKQYRHQTASLDRIDSSLGYVRGNLQWVHKDVNQMKMDLNQEYFIRMCKMIAERGV